MATSRLSRWARKWWQDTTDSSTPQQSSGFRSLAPMLSQSSRTTLGTPTRCDPRNSAALSHFAQARVAWGELSRGDKQGWGNRAKKIAEGNPDTEDENVFQRRYSLHWTGWKAKWNMEVHGADVFASTPESEEWMVCCCLIRLPQALRYVFGVSALVQRCNGGLPRTAR